MAPLSVQSGCEHDGFIQWGVAGRAFPGESESGDRHVVTQIPRGVELAVIDGLGHGPEAAQAACTIAVTFRDRGAISLADRVRACDSAAKGTRGAVLTAARIDDDGLLTWLGVGNVAGAVWRWNGLRFSVVAIPTLGNGVVGFNLPSLLEQHVRLTAGDLVVLATDGIDEIDQWSPGWLQTPAQMAEALVVGRARDNDDALAVVARYAGASAARR